MKILKIIVTSGQVFKNPYESFANLRTSITLEAELNIEDDPDECVRSLQIAADAKQEQHRQSLLDCLLAKIKLRGAHYGEESEDI